MAQVVIRVALVEGDLGEQLGPQPARSFILVTKLDFVTEASLEA